MCRLETGQIRRRNLILTESPLEGFELHGLPPRLGARLNSAERVGQPLDKIVHVFDAD